MSNDVNNDNIKNNDTKKILTLVVLIAVVMICTTSATYAYLAISATATNNITGTVASGNLSFTVNPTIIAPANSTYQSKPMIPQYAYNNSKDVLALALTGAGTDKCVDGNGNVVCKAYSFTVKNGSSATVVIDGSIKFTNPTTNLKWAKMTSATATPSITSATDTDIKAATTSDVDFESGFSLAANATKQFWLIFWINETGSTQTDSGTWYATISFTSSNGTGITSTITGA